MIFLKYDKHTKKVYYEHYKPFHTKHGLGKSQEELEKEGVFVDSIPEPLRTEGKVDIMYYTKEKGVYYEYEDIPESEKQIENKKIQKLEQQLLELQEYIINKEAEELLNQGGM